MAARARGRGSSHGIDGPILETSVGSAGKVLEAVTREARRRKAEVRNVASGSSAIEPRTSGAQEGFSRCRTPGETAGGPGTDSELCARCRAASVADGDAEKVPVDATECGCRTNWSLFWKRPTLSCPAWSRICWALVPSYAEGAR